MPPPSELRVAWAAVPDGAERRDVAWGLLRGLVPGASLSNVCEWCGGPHGRVRIAGGAHHASITYAGGLAIAAVIPASAAGALGVDAEPARAMGAHDALGVRSVRVWTRIEAALKADGRGLRVDAATVRLLPGSDGDGIVGDGSGGDWDARMPDTGARLVGWDLAGPDGVVVSAAVAPLPVSAGAAAPGGPATP